MEENSKSLHTLIEDVSDKMMQRFDNLENLLQGLAPRTVRKITELDGERLYNNQDLCEMFDKSKRSLQRYRSEGILSCIMIKHTTYYRESDVERFKELVLAEFEAKQQKKKKRKEKKAMPQAAK